MEERALVIGAGVAGLSAATTLASHGFRVTLVDRHPQPGGRASTWTAEGFTFDLGPSFYWMPDVIDRYFHRFGARTSDHFHLVRLDPGYRMIFGPGDEWDLPAGADAVSALFEQEESGAAAALRDYLHEAALKYDLGIGDVVYRPSLRWREYARYDLLAGLMRTTWLRSLRTHVRDHFRSARIRQVLEFPSLFLGAPPQRTPALYSLMNHADIALGTWYPMGGMGRLVDALMALAKQQGVEVRPNVDVTGIRVEAGRCVGVDTVAGPDRRWAGGGHGRLPPCGADPPPPGVPHLFPSVLGTADHGPGHPTVPFGHRPADTGAGAPHPVLRRLLGPPQRGHP